MNFNSLPNHDCDIVARDGTIRVSGTKGIFMPGTIILLDQNIIIKPGDEIRRRLPNETDETFEILDFHFVDMIRQIPSHYQVQVTRKGSFPHRKGGNYNINVSGSNARVNIASHDQSSNVAVEGDVFGSIAAKLKSEVRDEVALTRLLEAVEEMKQQRNNKSGLATAYQKFMSISADHIGIIAPFLPALAELFR